MSAAPEGASCSGRPVCGTAEASRDADCHRQERRHQDCAGESERGGGKRGRGDTETGLNEMGGGLCQGREGPEEAELMSQR